MGTGADAAAEAGAAGVATGAGDGTATGGITEADTGAADASDLPQLLQKFAPDGCGAPQWGHAAINGASAGVAAAGAGDDGVTGGAIALGVDAPQPAQKRAPLRLTWWHCAHSQPVAAAGATVGVVACPAPQPRQNWPPSA
jgi:hypothetical protein